MVGVSPVTLDPLPMKRVLVIEEAGAEHLPPEPAPEEKPRFLLQRIDFEQSEQKDAKKAKSNKEAVGQSASKWPWQGLVENLQQAHQELSIILDFLTHVEANDAITVASIVKPKQLLHEACSELALRASMKLHYFKKIGKYLKQTAKALEQQVEREAIFYGALMRLQRHWKVKRLRGISAGSGGNAGFTIDLSYPQLSADPMAGLSSRTAGLYTVNVEQDSSGLLMAHLPGRHINALQMHFVGPYTPHRGLRNESLKEDATVLTLEELNSKTEDISSEKKPSRAAEKDVGQAVNEGAKMAHSILRRIQTAVVDEQIFEWTVREALQPSSALVATGVQDNCLQLSLGHSCALVLELLKIRKRDNREILNTGSNDMEHDAHVNRRFKFETWSVEPDAAEMASGDCKIHEADHENPQAKGSCITFRKETSAIIYLQQAFYHCAFIHPPVLESTFPAAKSGQWKGIDGNPALSRVRDSGAGTGQDSVSMDAAGWLKHFSLTMRHRVFSARVLSELENLVRGVPYLFLSFHPTWHARITAWDLRLVIPQPVVHGWKMRLASWSSAKHKSISSFAFRVVLCDAFVSVEGLEAMQTRASTEQLKLSTYRCDLSELPSFLLYQLAGQLVKWLHEEAVVMGLKVRRDLLSLFFHLSSQDDVVIVASLDVQAYCINWWLQSQSPKVEDGQKEELVFSKSNCRRFLGPLNLETLRGILVDFLNICSDDS